MPTEAKQATVAKLKDEMSQAKTTIVADYRGLTVTDISAVRRGLRGEGITYRVVKNRLAKIAAQEAGNSELNELLTGPSALAMGSGDEVTLAKTFLDAIKPYRQVAVRGAVLSGKRVDGDAVTQAGHASVARACFSASWPVASSRRCRAWHRFWRLLCATWATPSSR